MALSLAPSHWARLLWKPHDVHSLHALVETFLPHVHVMEACVVSWDLWISYHVNDRRRQCSKVSCGRLAGNDEMILVSASLVQIPKTQFSLRATGSQDGSNGNVFKRRKVKTKPKEPHQPPPWSRNASVRLSYVSKNCGQK